MAPSRGPTSNGDSIPLTDLPSTNGTSPTKRRSSSSDHSRTSSQLEAELDNLLGPDHSGPSEPLLPEPSSSRPPRHHSPVFSPKALRRLHLRALRPRFLLCFLVPVLLLALVGKTAWHFLHQIPVSQLRSSALHHSPDWVRPWVYKLMPYEDGNYAPRLHPELLAAPWAGSWALPALGPPRYRAGVPRSPEPGLPRPHDLASSAFLMLHIFSTPTAKSRERRALLRRLSPILNVDPGWRHLIDVRFVLGRHDPSIESTEVDAKEEYAIEVESQTYGDIVRLDGLYHGENMNYGKSWEWINWVGTGGAGREAWWVFKCNEDTLPIMPNLLDYLVSQSPAAPTYVGTALGRFWGFLYYFEGMLYGFSWGVVKTIASAKIDSALVQTEAIEDAGIGDLMYSLPSSPTCETLQHQSTPLRSDSHDLESICDPSLPPLGDWRLVPPSPDPRTGLLRLDLQHRLSHYHQWWTASAKTAVGWHALKEENESIVSDTEYIKAYDEAQDSLRRQGRDIWNPPDSWDRYKDGWVAPEEWTDLPEQMTMTQGTNDWSTAIVQGS